MIRRVVFWQEFPSPHTIPYIRALAGMTQYDVTLVVQTALSPWRRDMGWDVPELSEIGLVIGPDLSTILNILNERDGECVHIFSGTHAYPLVWLALEQSLSTHQRIAILSEPADWRGVKGFARLLRSRFDARRIGDRVDFILAIGHTGVQWFVKSGYSPQKIYSFGYFTEGPIQSSFSDTFDEHGDGIFRMVYIGQCVERKGLDLLLRALGGLKGMPWHLDVVGDGIDRQSFQALTTQLKLSDRVFFWGTQKNSLAMRILDKKDLLILPSRWDGWGAVVNESLLRGVPVVCSNLCGAADLLCDSILGSVFKAGSVSDLRMTLAKRIASGPISSITAERIKDWSVNNIGAEAAARYLADIIIHSIANGKVVPTPPWRNRV